MFDRQVEHYERRFREAKEALAKYKFEIPASAAKLDLEKLKENFENNTVEFKRFVFANAGQLRQKTDSLCYAASLAVIADKLGKKYKVYLSYSLNKKEEHYEDKLEEYKKSVTPLANHVYVQVDDTCYELFEDNSTTDIDHLDSVELKEVSNG